MQKGRTTGGRPPTSGRLQACHASSRSVEKHSDGYAAYLLGLKTVVGEGDTFLEALADVKSAIRFHIDTFGDEVLSRDTAPLQAFIAEATIPA
jgi:predicted RNase H-like HicB family nuclease